MTWTALTRAVRSGEAHWWHLDGSAGHGGGNLGAQRPTVGHSPDVVLNLVLCTIERRCPLIVSAFFEGIRDALKAWEHRCGRDTHGS